MDSTTSLGREALDRVTGAAQRLAGSVTGRDDLTREGELHKQRADVAADARIEQERAAASQELAEAEQAEREAASERAELIAEKQRQEEMARAERDGAAQEAAVSAATRRAQDAAQADARRAMQQAEAKVQGAQRRKEAAQRHSAELGLQARLAADRAESFEQEPSTLVGKSFARGLATTRLPLTALERLTGHRDGQWAPSVLFGRFEAAVLQTAGGVLRNEDLQRQGRSRQAAAHSLEEAATTGAQAEQVQAEAQVQEKREVRAARQAQQQAERDAAEQTQQAQQRAQAREKEIEKTTQARKRTVAKRAASAQQGERNRRRTDALNEAQDSEQAASKKATAARKEQKVAELDKEIANSRRTRKSSS